MHLILIRHGETDWNAQRRYCGFTDIDLNQKGEWQAKKLSERIFQEKIYKIYSSNLKRARNFLKLAVKDTAVEEISGLREINFGLIEGLNHEEAIKKFPIVYKKWLNNPLGTLLPNAESLIDFAKRVREALKKIISSHPRATVAIFTHAGPIRVILSDILRVNLKAIWQIKQDCANINIVEFLNGKGEIILQNDTSYLHG